MLQLCFAYQVPHIRPTDAPITPSPSKSPSDPPSKSPTDAPITPSPSKSPSDPPTPEPTEAVTARPTSYPTSLTTPNASSSDPTSAPSNVPTPQPSNAATPPVTSLPLQLVFNAGAGAIPPNLLAECEGDCDNDSQCEVGLKCFQRTTFQAVPGCSGEGSSGKDYCYRPPPTSIQLVFIEAGAPPNPLPECHGYCNDDTHCEGDLVCFHRFANEPVPGCPGDASDFTGENFCAQRPTENTVWMKGDNMSPPENFPLGLCEGDCGRDSDCQPGLVW